MTFSANIGKGLELIIGIENALNEVFSRATALEADTSGVASHDYEDAAVEWELTAEEQGKGILIATNANGAVNAVATPTNGKTFIVRNATGQSLTIKPAAQTGITIDNARTAIVMGNGTDFIRITADQTH